MTPNFLTETRRHSNTDFPSVTAFSVTDKIITGMVPSAACYLSIPLHKKANIHQLTTMLATSNNVLFPGPNHLLTSSADDSTL